MSNRTDYQREHKRRYRKDKRERVKMQDLMSGIKMSCVGDYAGGNSWRFEFQFTDEQSLLVDTLARDRNQTLEELLTDVLMEYNRNVRASTA